MAHALSEVGRNIRYLAQLGCRSRTGPVHCPYCSWTPTNNARIHARCTTANHCYIADFNRAATHHRSWFVSDGVHMAVGGTGAKACARIVAAAYRAADG
jgi:hypothetical protein